MDIGGLIAGFGGFFWVVLAFVVALSIIVAIHEYGHYIVGRWSGIHADVFSIGFGPVIYSAHDKHGTRWQIAALPLGGYVKFAGDANAASGKDEDAMEAVAADPVALRATMHGAPLWARSLTVLAGPVFNFILSALIFSGVYLFSGVPSDPLTVGKTHPLPGAVVQLQTGDEIRRIAGQDIPSFESGDFFAFARELPRDPVLPYEVLRDGQEITVDGPYLMPARVGGVSPRSAAYAAGLQEGDVIVAIDGVAAIAFADLVDAVEPSEGRDIALQVWRAGEVRDITLAPKRVDEPQDDGSFVTSWRIGVASSMAFEPATSPLPFGKAVVGGVKQVQRIIKGSLTGIAAMVTGGISSCNVSGAIGIAQTSGAMAQQGLINFIFFIGVLSTAVGFINLFPIPMLDGGHLVFYAYEAVVRRPPSDQAMKILMSFGLLVVVSLMVFGLSNDLFCP